MSRRPPAPADPTQPDRARADLPTARSPSYDAIVIGSGFGGSLVARPLVEAGLRVLMLERGDWVDRGPHNWAPDASVDLTPFYSTEIPYRVLEGGNADVMGAYACVGGPSVFYGGVSMRFREDDFRVDPEIVGDSGARWPIGYSDLRSYYRRAEAILGVTGEHGADPTEPPRGGPYEHSPSPLSATSEAIARAARELGLSPFRLPLAINYASANGRRGCVACTTCDTYACAIEAKNDLATTVLPGLIAQGLELRPRTLATRLVAGRGRIERVECRDLDSGETVRLGAERVFLAAGAIGSPHLLLASRLEEANPAGDAVGRYLMRHCNGIVFGLFRRLPDGGEEFHKQLGIHDFYFGHDAVSAPEGKLGSVQQLQSPPLALVEEELPWKLGRLLTPFVRRLTGLLVMAEDQPRPENRVAIDWSAEPRLGLPQLTVTHRHTPRDLAARAALFAQSKRVLRRAGARFFYVHEIETFSHAVGTVRMGEDPATAPLDPYCRFRGIENLWVVDASFMPTSAGLNPSLTIAANALRVGEHVLEESV